MIRIIKHGKKSKFKYCECPYCGCGFEYEHKDVDYEGDCFWGWDLKERLRCPECNKNVFDKR